MNIKRRHLTVSQRSALATEMLPEFEKAAKERQGTRTDLTSSSKDDLVGSLRKSILSENDGIDNRDNKENEKRTYIHPKTGRETQMNIKNISHKSVDSEPQQEPIEKVSKFKP